MSLTGVAICGVITILSLVFAVINWFLTAILSYNQVSEKAQVFFTNIAIAFAIVFALMLVFWVFAGCAQLVWFVVNRRSL